MTFLINDYLNDENPLCREERQYALLLYNALRKNDEIYIKELNIQGNIQQVFFEVALMRDYWYANKEKFNTFLYKYLMQKFPHITCEIGNEKTRHINHWKQPNLYGKWMMNAKPDIAFVSYTEGRYFLNFLECKYLSKEANYKDAVNQQIQGTRQLKLQEDILDFLCNYLEMKLEIEGKHIQLEKGQIILCKFAMNANSNSIYNINIKDLIKRF